MAARGGSAGADYDDDMMGDGMEEFLLMQGGQAGMGGFNKEFIQQILCDAKPGVFFNSWGSIFDETDMKPLDPK